MIELRDLSLMLDLSKDQVGILKDYFAQSLKDEREELLPMTDNRDVQLTKGKYQKDRDDKIMSLLSEKQQPLFVAYLREKERGTIALPMDTEEGGKR